MALPIVYECLTAIPYLMPLVPEPYSKSTEIPFQNTHQYIRASAAIKT
jgi:hypothetical protein